VAEPLNEPLPIVALDERRNDRPRLLQALEAMEIHALLLQRAVEPLDHPVALGLAHVRRRDRDPEPADFVDPRLSVTVGTQACIIPVPVGGGDGHRHHHDDWR
jgi:hypothetical protein